MNYIFIIYMSRVITLKDIKPNKDIIFIIGMSAVGKTTISKILSKKLKYYVIHIDEIIRKISLNHNEGTKIYSLYSKNKYIQEKKLVIKKVRQLIKKYKQVIIEGAIFDPLLIRLITKNYTYTLIYIQPKSRDKYIKNIKKRVKLDLKNNTKKMSIVWKNLTINEVKDKKTLNYFIKQLVDYKLNSIKEDYELFKNFNLNVIIN